MSRQGIDNFIDTQYSSGDSKTMTKYQEENNNEVDELSKELSAMGCIVDAVKKPPNICVENCVYEGSDGSARYEEDAYSDEFEEDSEDDVSVKTVSEVKSAKSVVSPEVPNHRSFKLAKSQSTVSSNKAPASLSGRSSGYGSISIPPTRRINMSFTNERLREIERHNHILLSKILTARNSKKSTIPSREQTQKKPVPSAAVQRKNQQRKIDHDNMILLKKIQRAKSSAYSIRR